MSCTEHEDCRRDPVLAEACTNSLVTHNRVLTFPLLYVPALSTRECSAQAQHVMRRPRLVLPAKAAAAVYVCALKVNDEPWFEGGPGSPIPGEFFDFNVRRPIVLHRDLLKGDCVTIRFGNAVSFDTAVNAVIVGDV